MTFQRKLPTGRLGRVARLARVGVRTGANLLLSSDSTAAAREAAEIWGSLRGLAAKVGQMASYVDGFIPDEHREVYENALRTLRATAPTSSPAEIRSLVEEELRAPISELFAYWEDEPFASASIGQVHRARLEDDRIVAVKVQHPGVDRAIDADLANGRVVQSIVSTVAPRALDAKSMYDEVASRFREELDYRLEARHQKAFRSLYAGDDRIRIPAVVDERSSRRVLTTELAEGALLEEIAQAPEQRRRDFAEILWHFAFKGILSAGVFNADPHPGNYLFADDGTVTFLDFGCVQALTPAHMASAVRMHESAIRGDENGFADGVRRLFATRSGAFESALIEHSRQCFEPLFASKYRLTRSYVAGVVRGVQKLKRVMLSRDSHVSPLPPDLLLLNRLQFGFYSVLARLDVEVAYRDVERRFLGSSC